MDVYVIRHAQALPHGTEGEDAHRPLTPRGRKDARRLGRSLRREEVTFDALLSSPLVRAVETASLVAEGLDFEGGLEIAPELVPARDPLDVVREVLLPRAELSRVALVGHQPQLGALVAALLHSQANFSPRKASCVRLRWEGPGEPARFKWVLLSDGDEPSRALEDV